MRELRRALYQLARLLGDANAARRGPGAVARRAGRRVAYREAFRALRRLGH